MPSSVVRNTSHPATTAQARWRRSAGFKPNASYCSCNSNTLADSSTSRTASSFQPAIAAHELKTRTLTNLYNARPTWLDLAHRRLDAAVLAAYGWPADLPDDALLARLLELNLARSDG